MKRSKHSLSHYKLLTAEMGKLYPVSWYEALPGDTIQQATSMLVRVSPQVAPVMHPVSVRLHSYFVPNRLLMDGWEEFITGQETGTMPFWEIDGFSVNEGGLHDFLGVRPQQVPSGQKLKFSALPSRAYYSIYNEYFRDQDLVAEFPIEANSGILNVAWEKDYFTTSRPWAQKGGDVTIPLGNFAPVVPDTTGWPTFRTDSQSLGNQRLNTQAASPNVVLTNSAGSAEGLQWEQSGLRADLSAATGILATDLRRAMALQRYQEARAQYGSRYTEYLRYLGVQSSDARLQRPEYLGGGKATIAFSEVLRTGNTDTDESPIGQLAGHGISAVRTRRWRKFFEEHGIVMTLLSVRPRTMYADGLYRGFLRETKEDYWQRELELIGQQEVYNQEVFAKGVDPATGAGIGGGTFGYNDRYAEYRRIPNTIAGEFRSTLNYWHLARMFTDTPALNQAFVECDPSKRIFAEQTTNPLWVMCNHSVQARRLVGKRTIGRIS